MELHAPSHERSVLNGEPGEARARSAGQRRRWFLGLEPIFEGGRQGKRARVWDVEDELIAVALLGDVTIDLSRARSVPAEIAIEAYAIGRDVDVFVGEGTHVELFGGVLKGDLSNNVPFVPEERRELVLRIHGHTVFGDVTVRRATGDREAEPLDRSSMWARLTARCSTAVSQHRIGNGADNSQGDTAQQ